MAMYPSACNSEFCGRILCDGCRNREQLVSWYRRTEGAAGVERYERQQRQLRQQKADKVGAFSFLREVAA